MSNDNVIEPQKTTTIIVDPITEILRQGARKLVATLLLGLKKQAWARSAFGE